MEHELYCPLGHRANLNHSYNRLSSAQLPGEYTAHAAKYVQACDISGFILISGFCLQTPFASIFFLKGEK